MGLLEDFQAQVKGQISNLSSTATSYFGGLASNAITQVGAPKPKPPAPVASAAVPVISNPTASYQDNKLLTIGLPLAAVAIVGLIFAKSRMKG